MIPSCLVGRKKKVGEGKPPVWARKKNLPVLTPSWYNYMMDLVVEDFKCSVLRVAKVPMSEGILPYLSSCHYEFPNGYNQVIILKYNVHTFIFFNKQHIFKSTCLQGVHPWEGGAGNLSSP